MEQKLQDLINSFSTETAIVIDTPFLIYHLEDIEPYSELTTIILNSIGKNSSKAYLSLISYTEILIGVFKQENSKLERQFRLFFENNLYINIVDFKFDLAECAAEVRIKTKLGLADSIIIATAIKTKSNYLLTNDKGILKAKDLGVNVIFLDDLINCHNNN